MTGINIYSGADALGAALTNPTELAFRKGALTTRYPVTFANRAWPDAEAAYLTLKTGNACDDDRLMADIIAAKLRQHPGLKAAIAERGGVFFLERCTHFTQARSERFQSWEGEGRSSRFIRNLIAGYEQSEAPSSAFGQTSLF